MAMVERYCRFCYCRYADPLGGIHRNKVKGGMMILFGKPYTKKEIRELPLGKLLSTLASDSIVNQDRNNGHKGARKERAMVVKELFFRYNLAIPTSVMIDEMFG